MKKIAAAIALLAVLGAGCSQTAKKRAEESPISVVTEPQEVMHQKKTKKKVSAVKPQAIVASMPAKEQPGPSFVPKAPGRRIARVSVPGKYVALTFDDGPSASITPRILDILSRHGVRATFFVLGENAVRNKSVLARAAAEGHEIASHTWNHVNMTKANLEEIVSQMDRTAAVVQEATGRKPALMRPPYGAVNKGIIDLMVDRYGTPAVLWDVDTVDWKHPGVSVVVDRAVNQARNGSIILLHDIHASTLQAVEGVVAGLLNRGFRLVTVSQLIRMGRRAAGVDSQPAPPAPTIANTLPPGEEGGDGAPSPQPEPKRQEPESPADLAGVPQQVVAAVPHQELSEVVPPEKRGDEQGGEPETEESAQTHEEGALMQTAAES